VAGEDGGSDRGRVDARDGAVGEDRGEEDGFAQDLRGAGIEAHALHGETQLTLF